MAICKLCQEEKPLIGRSHIIPDFFFCINTLGYMMKVID
jgi:hypothetical protein